MSKNELARRMNSVTKQEFNRAVEMVREGYGAHGITLEHTVGLKVANAAFEWVNRYGRLVPFSGLQA